MALPVRIIDATSFELIGEVTLYSSLQITRSWHGVGSLELRVNRYLPSANELTIGRVIFPQDKLHKAYIIRSRELALDENGKVSETWIIKAQELKGILDQRITIPYAGEDQVTANGNTEWLMKHLVNRMVVLAADPTDIMPEVTFVPPRFEGPKILWTSRYKNLAEELTEISIFTGIGWNMYIDIERKKFVFDAYLGRDLSVEQNALPPAIFSSHLGTVAKLNFSDSILNYKNFAIVAGQGEGAARRIVKVGDSSGLNKHVLFVDARDIAETKDDVPRPEEEVIAELTTRGLQKLAELNQETYLEAEALQTGGLSYEKNYDLGDIVTIQSREWGLQRNARITEVREIYEPSGKRIELTFGYAKPTIGTIINQRLDAIKPEVTR